MHLKDTLLLRAISPIIRIAAKFKFIFPLLRTLALICTIAWFRGRPHIESCTSRQRSRSREAVVDVKTFHRSCLKLRMILLLEIRVSQNLAKLGGGEGGGGGGDIKCQGFKGERFRENCVALEGGFQHRL